ncbi:hypothetical protein FRC12_020979 [Ceratobasidium sp. 428]|nr:hypothetical protein FRC12_020979 [Ceratobasidium sp. 428]
MAKTHIVAEKDEFTNGENDVPASPDLCLQNTPFSACPAHTANENASVDLNVRISFSTLRRTPRKARPARRRWDVGSGLDSKSSDPLSQVEHTPLEETEFTFSFPARPSQHTEYSQISNERTIAELHRVILKLRVSNAAKQRELLSADEMFQALQERVDRIDENFREFCGNVEESYAKLERAMSAVLVEVRSSLVQ